jgi:hypothetical protein
VYIYIWCVWPGCAGVHAGLFWTVGGGRHCVIILSLHVSWAHVKKFSGLHESPIYDIPPIAL